MEHVSLPWFTTVKAVNYTIISSLQDDGDLDHVPLIKASFRANELATAFDTDALVDSLHALDCMFDASLESCRHQQHVIPLENGFLMFNAPLISTYSETFRTCYDVCGDGVYSITFAYRLGYTMDALDQRIGHMNVKLNVTINVDQVPDSVPIKLPQGAACFGDFFQIVIRHLQVKYNIVYVTTTVVGDDEKRRDLVRDDITQTMIRHRQFNWIMSDVVVIDGIAGMTVQNHAAAPAA